jgi:hypothetical protein
MQLNNYNIFFCLVHDKTFIIRHFKLKITDFSPPAGGEK